MKSFQLIFHTLELQLGISVPRELPIDGKYIPFGAMLYYQDNSLLELIHTLTRMVRPYELTDLLQTPKTAERVFGFLKELFKSYMLVVSLLPNEDFVFFVQLILSGLGCESGDGENR